MLSGFKAYQFIIEPMNPAGVINGSVFYDSTNSNKLSYKDLSGVITVIG